MDSNERFSRQRDVVPAGRLDECGISVIGVGAVGRQVALQLAAIGVKRLQLIDFDTVDESNLASQGYLESDLARRKIDATAELCRSINPRINVETVFERYRRSTQLHPVVFCCVDSIESRRHIWQSTGGACRLFIDARMTAEVIRILAAWDDPSRNHYCTTLFAAGQAFAGSCTAKMTIFGANIAAGLMLSQFSKWLRALTPERDMCLNLLAGELTAA